MKRLLKELSELKTMNLDRHRAADPTGENYLLRRTYARFSFTKPVFPSPRKIGEDSPETRLLRLARSFGLNSKAVDGWHYGADGKIYGGTAIAICDGRGSSQIEIKIGSGYLGAVEILGKEISEQDLKDEVPAEFREKVIHLFQAITKPSVVKRRIVKVPS